MQAALRSDANSDRPDRIPGVGHRPARRNLRTAEEAQDAAPEREADDGAGDDVGGVVHPHVDPAAGDDGGERVPERVAVAGRARIVAAVNAAVAWPEGNDDVIGRRMP